MDTEWLVAGSCGSCNLSAYVENDHYYMVMTGVTPGHDRESYYCSKRCLDQDMRSQSSELGTWFTKITVSKVKGIVNREDDENPKTTEEEL